MLAQSRRSEISDIYELSPMQQAMLFQSVYAPDSQVYFDQFSCFIIGNLDVNAFRTAWQNLADRHPIFRTSFHWQDLPKPMQVVHASANVPWSMDDWSGQSQDAQIEQWQSLLEKDRQELFRLDRTPLMRFHLVRSDLNRYFFAWSHHHIILDGWCLSLILTELLSTYRAIRSKRHPVLNPVRPYRNYILWLQSQDEKIARDYWTRELRGFTAPTELPFMISHAERSAMADRTETFWLSDDLSQRLIELTTHHQITASTLVQASWAILLQRYSGQNDVVFGATVSGRPSDVPGVEEMLGLFINTIPIRMHVDSDMLLISWAKEFQSRQAVRFQYSHTSLIDIQQSSEVSRGTPLFNSNLIFQNYPLSHSAIRGAGEFEISEARMFEQTDIPLTLQVTPGDRWQIELVYDRGQFESDVAHRIAGHFIHLLEEFVANPNRRIAEFSILTVAELRQIFDEFNNSAVEFEKENTVVHRFEAIANKYPDNIVLQCGEHRLTARELNGRANQLARCLLDQSAPESEDIVAILMRRSDRIVESILAVWKCGGAYVPIDPNYPEERIKTIIESAGAKIVISQQGDLSNALKKELNRTTTVVLLDELEDARNGKESSDLNIPIGPANLAYVIFTSGSTGKPKGAMVEHVGMLNHILSKVHDLEIEPSSVIAQSASHCFDISIWQMFAAPMVGGKTVVYQDDTVLEPDRFIEMLESDGVTIMEVVPSYLSVILDRIEDRNNPFPSLRYLQATGEPVSPALIQRWFQKLPHIPVANAYGPTECSDNVTHYTMQAAPNTATVPIGKPLRNFNIYIVDEYMNLCPVGVKGEICASGIGVGRGYLNDPERTSAVFIDDPFIEGAGRRLYRTGDIGCYLPDGNIQLFGRRDHQVKLRGFRIELGEIEIALTRLEGIRDAVVLVRHDGKDSYLCAYYTLVNAFDKNSETIARELHRDLPDYMIPSVFVKLDDLPLTLNGKVDRKALPTPDLTQRPSSVDYVAPRTEAESLLADVWRQVLGVDSPGVNDNFFNLGGDSILSMQIVSRAKHAGLKLAVVDVFRYPTIAKLAEHTPRIDRKEVVKSDSPSIIPGPLPLTPIQKYFLETTTIDPHHYNQSVFIEAPSGVGADLLKNALKLATNRHDSLRLRFKFAAGQWQQEVSESVPDIPFIVKNLSEIPETDHRQVIELIACELHRSLSLSDGPLMTAALFVNEELPASLLLIAHHLTVDGVSWRVLLEDLMIAYEQLSAGQEIALPETTSTYREWSDRLSQYARDGIYPLEKDYWLDVAHAQSATIPVDFSDSSQNNGSVDTTEEVRFELDDRDTTKLLTETARAYNTHINDLLLTTLALALRDWTGEDQIKVELEGHGREPLFDDIDMSRTTGWFTAQFPIVLRVKDEPNSLIEHVKTIKETLRQIPHHGIGYGLLRYLSDDTDTRQNLAAMAPPQILFNYLGQTDRSSGSRGGWKADIESVGPAQSPRQLREHLIEVNCFISNGRFKLIVSYSRNLHKKETVQSFADSFKTHLQSIIEHCARPDTGGFTQSDFPLAGLDQESLDILYSALKETTGRHPNASSLDVFRLSPVQLGMLFHSLYTPDSDSYFNQFICDIDGEVDEKIFRQSWTHVIAHHSVLRTSFHWEALVNPVQAVHPSADPKWRSDDWSNLFPTDQEKRWGTYLQDDRRQKFDLALPPLMRFGLIRLGKNKHRFIWSHHHLLLDGWSTAIILSDVLNAYEALLKGKHVNLNSRRSFRESVEWLANADAGRAEGYWRGKLSGITGPTPLVLGAPELEGIPGEGGHAEEVIYLPPEFTQRLQADSRQWGVTLNTIAQAAWSLLLSRYSGEYDVVYGSIVSGRPPELDGADEMVGIFINTLPVRAHIDPDQSLSAWLDALQIDQIEREQYAYSSLSNIQRWSWIPIGTQLFESILIFENYPTDELLKEGTSVISISRVQAIEPNNFPITLVATPGRSLSIKIMYDADRFDRATIQRIIGHYRELFRRFIDSPRQSIGSIDILTIDERNQILRDWNRADAPMPDNKTTLDLFQTAVSLYAGRKAIQCGEISLTYDELNARSNQLARHILSTEEIKPDDRIAVLLPRSEGLLECLIAIWKCRGAYVPIDPNYPSDRIATIIADCGATLLITDSDVFTPHTDAIKVDLKTILLDDIESSRDGLAMDDLKYSPLPSDLAYVFYTSGSTGKPKGVMIEHRGVLNHLLAKIDDLEIGSDCIVAQTASHCFDISVWQFFAALVNGGRTIIYTDEMVLNTDELIDRLTADAVQVVQFVPSYLAVFLDVLERRQDDSLLNNLQWIILIGEILKPSYVQRWFDLYPAARMMNSYGPTEISDSVTHYLLDRMPSTPSLSIGRPIRNTRVYIVDPQMNLCPVGVKGEVCIGGIGIGRGYLGDEERTRLAFVADPFSDIAGAQMYRAGDIACYSPSGDLFFFGRKDHQVKVRGHRIESGEIESILVQIDGVHNGVVIVPNEKQEQKTLCAFLTLKDGVEKSPADIALELSLRLPSYMVPDVVRILSEMPHTTSGKVDRKRLPIDDIVVVRNETYSATTTEMEHALVRIWQDVLRLDQVGIDDHFTDLGGHSLLAVQAVGRIRNQLRRDLTFADLFSLDTIRQLAEKLETLRSSDVVKIPRIYDSEHYEASHAQKRIWLASRSRESSIAYNMNAALWLDGDLDIESLKNAVAILVERHESLRTSFLSAQGSLRQRIGYMEDCKGALEVIDLRSDPMADDKAVEIALRAGETAFDLSAAPLFRIKLIRTSDAKYLLAATLHHIIGDAWSLQVMLAELLNLYTPVCEFQASRFQPLPIQYKDYAAWHNEWLRSPSAEKQREFWLERLSTDMPRVLIPTDFPFTGSSANVGDSIGFEIDSDCSAGIRQSAENHRTSVYAVVLAGIYALVFRYTNQRDLVIGTQTAGRDHPDLETQVGCFVNTLVLRASVSEHDTISNVIDRIGQVLADSIKNQNYPFDKLLEDLKVQLLPNQTRLFDIQVDYVPALNKKNLDSINGLKISESEKRERVTKFPISFLIGEATGKNGLAIEIVYNANLFKRESILVLAERLRRILRAFVDDESLRIGGIELSEKRTSVKRTTISLNIPG